MLDSETSRDGQFGTDVAGHAGRGHGSLVKKEAGLMEFRFQPDLFERGHVSAQAGPISIWIRGLAAVNRVRFATRRDQ
jgi:hypothetical protein